MATINDVLDQVDGALTPARRLRLYRIVQGILLVLGLHGLVSADDAAGYLQAVIYVLGIAPAHVAARNTPR